jgi:hypothetical protein
MPIFIVVEVGGGLLEHLDEAFPARYASGVTLLKQDSKKIAGLKTYLFFQDGKKQ